MKIVFACEGCGGTERISNEQDGAQIRCRGCGKPMCRTSLFDEEFPRVPKPARNAIQQHKIKVSDLQLPGGNEPTTSAIFHHIDAHLGPVDMVFHELIFDLVHLDVHWIKPTAKRPYHTLVTSGMSDRPMATPRGAENYRYCELLLALPAAWPISEQDFEDESNYWPVRWLKQLARFPHECDTWLFHGHTVPNGDPPEPFAGNTCFCGWILLPPRLAPGDFEQLQLDASKTIHFLAIYPLYREEMNLKLEKGVDTLIEGLEKHDVCEVLNLSRKNTAKRSFWPFR